MKLRSKHVYLPVFIFLVAAALFHVLAGTVTFYVFQRVLTAGESAKCQMSGVKIKGLGHFEADFFSYDLGGVLIEAGPVEFRSSVRLLKGAEQRITADLSRPVVRVLDEGGSEVKLDSGRFIARRWSSGKWRLDLENWKASWLDLIGNIAFNEDGSPSAAVIEFGAKLSGVKEILGAVKKIPLDRLPDSDEWEKYEIWYGKEEFVIRRNRKPIFRAHWKMG